MSAGPPSQRVNWDDFRRQMPVTRRWAYLDHAAVAPLSGPAEEAIRGWAQQAATDGDTRWGQWADRVERTRQYVAALIGASAGEIALMPNTTAGINLVAEGYPWKEGDNVVIPADEFPANVYPWLNLAGRGVQTRRVASDGVRVDLDGIARACDRRTRIVSVSWVGYATGWRVDVDRLTDLVHDRGALLLLDAIQGLGVFPIDVRRTPIDFLAADGHKWLLGPEGAGVFYARGEHLDMLRPVGVGWNSVTGRYDFAKIDLDFRPEAARYEGGSQNMVGIHGLAASLELLARFGASPTGEAIAKRVLEVTDRSCQRLQRIGAQVLSDRRDNHRSGIVAFQLPGIAPETVRQHCLRSGVVLSHRGGHLRISPHAYTSDTDIDRLISSIAQLK